MLLIIIIVIFWLMLSLIYYMNKDLILEHDHLTDKTLRFIALIFTLQNH